MPFIRITENIPIKEGNWIKNKKNEIYWICSEIENESFKLAPSGKEEHAKIVPKEVLIREFKLYI